MPSQETTVTIRYVDTEGKDISDKKVISGIVGEAWDTKALDIKDYLLVGNKDTLSGVHTSEDTEAFFVYEPIGVLDALVPDIEAKEDLSDSAKKTPTAKKLAATGAVDVYSILGGASILIGALIKLKKKD